MCRVSAVKKSTLILKVGFDRKTGFRPLTWVFTAKTGFRPLTGKKFAATLGVVFFCTPYTCLIFQMAPGIISCHHNRHLMRHFEFLHGSRMICLPLNISEKML